MAGWRTCAWPPSISAAAQASLCPQKGLVLSNHHVGSRALQRLSTREHNYLRDGFYARTRAEEQPCAGLELRVLVSIEDVTARVNAAVAPGLSDEAAFKARRAAMAAIEKESLDQTGLRSEVVTLYQGGQYHLYRYKKYSDIRLVFAPATRLPQRRRERGRGRRFREETPVARPALRIEDAQLSLEAVDRSVDVRHPEENGRVVDQIASREVVGTVHDYAVAPQEVERVLGGKAHRVGYDPRARVERLDPLLRCGHLGATDVRGRVEHLALEVRELDRIEVHDADLAHAGRRKIECGGGSQTSRPDDQDLRLPQLPLAWDAEFGQQEVTAGPGSAPRA